MHRWTSPLLKAAAPAVGAALVLTACSGPAAQEAASSGDGAAEGTNEVTIAMATTACLNFFPVYVAQEEGIFAEEGLDVRIEKMNGSAAVLQAMLSGQAQLGTPGAAPVILANAEGSDIDFVANLKPGGSFALVAHGESGIDDASELEGRTVGVATADGNEVNFTNAVLESAGLSPDAVDVLVVGEGGQAVAGFERGDIDAYAASMDGVATLTQAGIPVTNVTGEDVGYFFGNGLAATQAYAAENGEDVEAFGRAYKRAMELGFEDPALVTAACEQHQPQEVEDQEYVEAMLEAVEISMAVPEGRSFGEQVEGEWQRLIDGLVESGDIEAGAVNASDVFTNDFVEGYNE